MHEDSPLDVLADQIRSAEVKRKAVEEKLMRTPSWRFRRRTQLERRVERRREQEREMTNLLEIISEKFHPSNSR